MDTKPQLDLNKELLSRGGDCNMVNIFRVSDIIKYEKRGKYLPVMPKVKYDNYFIVKCLLKSNVARVISLT